MKKLTFYWHNGRSLGHTAEVAKISSALVEASYPCYLTGLTGAFHGLDLLPPDMDVLKLPSFRNYDRTSGWDLASTQGLSPKALFALRSEINHLFIQHYQPDVLFVNHIPRGAEDELEKALGTMHGVKILTLRGILFDREKTHREYFGERAGEWIREHYQCIFVHTDPSIVCLEDIYDIPADIASRIRYSGYLTKPAEEPLAATRARLGIPDAGRLIVASMGGGQGALPIWIALVNALKTNEQRFSQAILVTGPYLEEKAFQHLSELVGSMPSLMIRRYERDLTTWMNAADLVVGAAGGNMLGEIVANRWNSIVIPRQVREPEQQWHASLLAKKNLVRTCKVSEIMEGYLPSLIQEALERPLEMAHVLATAGASRYPYMLQTAGL